MAKSTESEKSSGFLDIFSEILGKVSLPWLISSILIISFVIFLFCIHSSVSEDPQFLYSKNALNMKNELPRWVEENGLTNKIRLNNKEVSKSYLGKSSFAHDTLPSLHTALIGTHWVKDVKLEKSYPAKIDMTVEFRRPVAAFYNREYWYVLDEECHLIPVVEKKGQENLDVVRLVDVPNLSQTLKPGDSITEECIKRAVALSIMVTDRFTTSGKLLRVEFVKALDEKQYRYRLIFQNGLEVMWGNFLRDDEIERFPGKYLSSEEKLGLLISKLGKNPAQLHFNVEFAK